MASEHSSQHTTPRPRHHRRRIVLGLAIYLALLATSHLVQRLQSSSQLPDPSQLAVEIPLTNTQGKLPGPPQRIAYRRWQPESTQSDSTRERLPVILLHGSPGSSSAFNLLGPLLARAGYDTIAPDLPGFGNSTKRIPSYSFLAHAHAIILFMDTLGIERAHIVGWSQGGGVSLQMADLAPERTATITLMSSVGVQEAEGSGSYSFEHFKYALGYVGLVLGGELIPHFGILGDHDFRRSFIRNFCDSDPRPFRSIMQRLDTPTLILHGKDDFLTPEWGARLHHQLITPSTLIILDASHFLPFAQAEETTRRLTHFFEQNSTPGNTFRRETIDLTTPVTSLGARANLAMLALRQHIPWWVVILTLAALTYKRAELVAAVAGLAVSMGWIDAGVAAAGLLLGITARSTRPPHEPIRVGPMPFLSFLCAPLQPWRWDQNTSIPRGFLPLAPSTILGTAIGCILWTGLAFLAALITATLVRAPLDDSLPALITAAVAALLVVRTLVFACTWIGRQRLKATLRRTIKHELWPAWAYYWPLVPWCTWLGLRHGGLMSFTCANPTIADGGGMIGESKHDILRALAPLGDAVLPAIFIPPNESNTRFHTLKAAMNEGTLPPDYPLVLKPDAGQRGYGVRITRSDADAKDYLVRMDRAVIAQAYHPGPIEIGIMWARNTAPRTGSDNTGRVLSLTIKHFPQLEADGRHTLEQLIYRHPRYRCQADILLARLADTRHDIPKAGELVSLGSIGNHSQGSIFCAADEHITPELEAWIDRAAGAFCAPTRHSVPLPEGDNGLDFCRFDIRVRSLDDLHAARNLGIIELNGSSAESTSIYDPDKSLLWSWRALLAQWAALYTLGGWRRAQGVRPMGPRTLRNAWRDFHRNCPPMHVAK